MAQSELPQKEKEPVVLVAEDEADISTILELGLRAAGFTVLKAEDGQKALDMARSERPDLIILDVMMPNLSGFDVARLLKFDVQYRHIPIVMLREVVSDDIGASSFHLEGQEATRLANIENAFGREIDPPEVLVSGLAQIPLSLNQSVARDLHCVIERAIL